MKLILTLVLMVLLLLSWQPLCAAGTASKKKKRGSKDWSKVNFDDLEKEWEGGDDEEELEYEYQRVEKLIEKKKASQPAFDPNDPSSVKRHLNDMKKGGGKDNTEPKMMFIALQRETPKGVLWTKELLDDLAARWTALVQTASLSADFYNLGGKTPDKQTLMVNVVKPWFLQDIMMFLAQQPEVVSITKDSKVYTTAMLLEDEL